MRKEGRIPELDGLRVAMIFIVSWYHIWQQSWLTPVISIPSAGIWISLDSLLRSGYVWVDGTVLLSAFLLYLPLARKGLERLPDTGEFLRRKARRILPGYWFIILVFFFGMCLPWGLYKGDGPYMVKDLFTHMTLIFPYFPDTYVYTPMGAAPWTLSLVAQGYLLFPLVCRGLGKKPGLTLGLMTGFTFCFRAWCVWGLKDYTMVVNTFANFLDVYAAGFGCAMIYARLEKAGTERPGADRRKALIRQAGALLLFIGSLAGVLSLLKIQAGRVDHAELQKYQMIFRPAFALGFGGMILSAPFGPKPLRFLLGNRVTAFLASVSMNYYLIHQTLAVHLRRMGFPPSASPTPNMAGEQPWQTQYTLAVFGLSLLAAILVTYGVEKPAGRWLEKRAKKHLRTA